MDLAVNSEVCLKHHPRWKVFTARYALISYIKQTRFVLKVLKLCYIYVCLFVVRCNLKCMDLPACLVSGPSLYHTRDLLHFRLIVFPGP
jgi:hypothetical protein